MVNYYTVSYKLKEHDLSGNEALFEKTASSYIAHEIASSKEEAVAKLKSEFSMLDLEVVSVSDMKSISEEEFLSTGKLR